MPISIALANSVATLEYHYRNHPLVVSRGSPLPIGATATPSGINFVLICRHGTAVWLVLSETCSGVIHAEIPLDAHIHRTGDHWHVRVDGLPEEFCYGYRVDGPHGDGHRYDPAIILLDPHAQALSCGRPWATGGTLPRRSLMTEFVNDHQRAMNPRVPLEDTIIYELHVRGYTIDPKSGVKYPGTYAGLVEKIDELKALGITAVELLPVDEFDENDCAFVNPMTGEKLRNYWGYSPILFCAPRQRMRTTSNDRVPGKNFAKWSMPFTRRGSKFTWTSCSITLPRGEKTGLRTIFAAWTIRFITCSTRMAAT